MTFVLYADAVSAGIKWSKMYNKAGTLVAASTTTVQSAMAAFLPEFGQSNFTVDIYDADGTNSWPLALMSYVSLARTVTAFDCNVVRELLNFVAWIHTNDGYSPPQSYDYYSLLILYFVLCIIPYYYYSLLFILFILLFLIYYYPLLVLIILIIDHPHLDDRCRAQSLASVA
jgi:hypothetical protein